MRIGDFCQCTPNEFDAICEAYAERRESDYKERWERARLLATIVIQPHLKKKVSPKNLLPFPWEKQSAPKVSAREDLEKLNKLTKKATG